MPFETIEDASKRPVSIGLAWPAWWGVIRADPFRTYMSQATSTHSRGGLVRLHLLTCAYVILTPGQPYMDAQAPITLKK